MNCQKCKLPLKLDSSLQDLNPAAFDILVGLSSQRTTLKPQANPKQGSSGRSAEQNISPSRPPFPHERRKRYDEASQSTEPALFKRNVPPPKKGIGLQAGEDVDLKDAAKENPAMSFVMLTDSQYTPPPPAPVWNGGTKEAQKSDKSTKNERELLVHHMEASQRLFEILSARSDIDHPICTECTELLLNNLQARLNSSIKERDAYISYLRELKNSAPTASEVAQAEAELSTTKAAEDKAFEELLALEQEKLQIEDEVAELERESRQLDTEEEEFWRARNAFSLELTSFTEARDALTASYEHDLQQYERLRRTNVYNDTFCIGHDGDFGTINGLRLGRLPPPKNVDWAEINAAWGTTALLLQTVAEKLGFAFRGYKIKLTGSTTHIERIEVSNPSSTTNSTTALAGSNNVGSRSQQPARVTSLELFSSGDLPLGKTFLHRRFNDAMVAFLACLRQLGDFVANDKEMYVGRRSPQGMKLPYKIEKDRINELSIRLGTSPDEVWTNACKYVLTCCKFLLAHASNVGGRGRVDS